MERYRAWEVGGQSDDYKREGLCTNTHLWRLLGVGDWFVTLLALRVTWAQGLN